MAFFPALGRFPSLIGLLYRSQLYFVVCIVSLNGTSFREGRAGNQTSESEKLDNKQRMSWAQMLPQSPREAGCCAGPAQGDYIISCPRIMSLGKLKPLVVYVYLLSCDSGDRVCTDPFSLCGRRKKLPSVVRTLFHYYVGNKPFAFSGITSFPLRSWHFVEAAVSREAVLPSPPACCRYQKRGRDGSEPLDRRLFTLGGRQIMEAKSGVVCTERGGKLCSSCTWYV